MTSKKISRRNIAKGAAWAAPITLAAATVPAYAASTPFTGLNGLVGIRKVCTVSGSYDYILLDGRGTYPTRGLWVENSSADTVITNAALTIYLPTSFGTLSWRDEGGSGGWSVPTVDTTAPPQPNVTAYTTWYRGSWTFNSQNSVMVSNSSPYFKSSSAYGDGRCTQAPNFNAYSLRRVTINGRDYTISRQIRL